MAALTLELGFIWGMSGKGERVMSEVQTKGRRPVQNSSPWIACFSPYLWAAAILVLTTTGAYAEEGGKASEVIFLVELLALMVVGRLFGEAMNRIGQPSVMGPLLAGILLGPSVLGWLWPDLQHWIFPAAAQQKMMIGAISQFGILLLLLLTGMETDLKLVRKVGKAVISISLTGIAVPFACGVMLGWFMPESLLPDPEQRLLTSLFLGTALSISSIKIVAMVVREMNFTRRNLGQVIVASAITEDTVGWTIIAIIFSLAEAGEIDFANVAKSVIGTAVFLIGSFTIGRQIVSYLIRWTNDNFESDFAVITTILVILIGMALMTHFIGVHTVLGAFVAGILIGESPILTKYIDAQLRGLILAFFMPVFFGLAGLTADLTILTDTSLLLMTLGLIAIASIGKFVGAFVGAGIGGLTRSEALALACGMNARGSTEIIIATIGLSMGALSQNLYTMIVAMAVTTTMAMPPMLRWALSRLPLGKAEKKRLEREEFEAKGFVANLERLLLAVDDSANGKFTSHVAGLIAGSRGMPITVLQLMNAKRKLRKTKADPEAESVIEETVKGAAESTKKSESKEGEPVSVAVTVRETSETPNEEAVTSEAKKGYDLLFVGIDDMRAKNGTFSPKIGRIAAAFEGPVAIVMGQGDHLKRPNESRFNILVPIAGSGVSRRAAEVAFSLGRGCLITALYVATTTGRRPTWRRMREHRHEQAILKEVVEMAGLYDIKIKTVVRSNVAPDEAILTETKKGNHNIIVMGVKRRPGDDLFFGDTAAAICTESPCSFLLLSN
jgi:Kef-type K+ transport system membrane component KefB/nucleotide-binding universal stress UspA family protein